MILNIETYPKYVFWVPKSNFLHFSFTIFARYGYRNKQTSSLSFSIILFIYIRKDGNSHRSFAFFSLYVEKVGSPSGVGAIYLSKVKLVERSIIFHFLTSIMQIKEICIKYLNEWKELVNITSNEKNKYSSNFRNKIVRSIFFFLIIPLK